MRFVNLRAALLVLILLTASAGFAQGQSTQDDAKALVLKAVDLIAAKGLDGASPALHQVGEFRHDDLYVNVINTAGLWLVYPPGPSGEGHSVLQVQDATGKFLVQDIIKTAGAQGEGWVEYRWMNPATKQIGPKVSFVKRVPGTDLIVYAGIYK
jgi:signal transduction histidine kinase